MLAEGSRWTRLRHRPFTYSFFQIYDKLVYPIVRRGLEVSCHTFFGQPMQVRIPAGAAIFLTGGLAHDSEKKLIRYLLQRFTENDVFVDVGAHFGFYSLLACRCIGTGNGISVLALEPSESSFALLKKNLQAYPQAQAVQALAGDRERLCTFLEFDERFSEYNSAHAGRYQGQDWIKRVRQQRRELPCLPLHQLCAAYGIVPSIIKIDVEGMEPEVIEGAAPLLQRPCEVIMEYFSDPAIQEPYRRAERWLREAGYCSYLITASGTLQPVADVGLAVSSSGLDSDNVVFRNH